MPMQMLDLPRFAAAAKAGSADGVGLRLANTGAATVGADGTRTVSYVFSDETVARDGHTIASAGWQLDNFRSNPVLLWAHDSSAPPIGRIVDVGVTGSRLAGSVEYADPDTYPFADTIFRLVKGGYLNAVSVSWLPLEWKFSTDKTRQGGIDFKRQELLEVSQVPVPALPSALVTARAAGIDTRPLFDWAEKVLDSGDKIVLPRQQLEDLRRAAKPMAAPAPRRAAHDWKVGAESDLPVDDKAGWDGPAAAERMLSAAGFDGDAPDSAKGRRGFLVYDAANAAIKGSYKEPFADIVDGELRAMKAGLTAAASRLPQTDVPQPVRDAAQAVLDAYDKKQGKEPAAGATEKRGHRAAGKRAFSRDLYTVSWLSQILQSLVCMQGDSAWEEEYEGDDSPIPERLAEVVHVVAQILLDMNAEEVAELLASPLLSGDKTAAVTHAAALIAKRALRHLAPPVTGKRQGKVLSAENEAHIRAAQASVAEGMDHLTQILSAAETADADPAADSQVDPTAERAARARRAKLLRLNHSRLTDTKIGG